MVAARVIGLVRGIVLAWLMVEKREFGLFQITLLAVNILTPLCSIGLNEGAARYVPLYETRHALRPFLRRTVPMVLGVGLVLSLVAYLVAEPLGRLLFATLEQDSGLGMDDPARLMLTRLVVGTTFALIGYFLLLSILKGMRMFRAVSLMEFVNNVAFTLLAILAALWGWRSAGAILACYGITLVIVAILFMMPFARLIGRASDQLGPLNEPATPLAGRSVVDQMLRFSSWAALAAIMWQTLQYYPMWFLQKIHGPEPTAVFGGVRLMTQVVLIGAVSVVTVVQTSVTKTWESRGSALADRHLQLAFKVTALGLLLGCVVFSVPAGLIIRLLPPSYAEGATIIPLSLLAFLIAGHLSFLAIHFNLIEKTRFLFWPWAIGVSCNVAAGIGLIKPELDGTSALRAAAWVGVIGTTGAISAAIALVRSERRPLDKGSYVLIVSSYALALPTLFLCIVGGLLVVVAYSTKLIFDVDEKQLIRGYATTGRHKLGQLFAFCFRSSSHNS